MKKIIITTLLVITAWYAQAQTASEEKLEYGKSMQLVSVIEYPFKADIVQDAIKAYFDRKGIKADRVKVFLLFRNIKLNETDEEPGDYYILVEKRKRSGDESALVKVMSVAAGKDIKTKVPDDNFGLSSSRRFLNGFIPSIQSYDLEVKVRIQEDVVRKSEKKMNTLVEDGEDLQRKKKNIEQKIEENKVAQENQAEEVRRQKEILDLLKKRKTS